MNHPLFLFVPGLALLLAGAATAQNAGDMRACRAIADDTARLACYDRALDAPAPAADSAAAPAVAPQYEGDLFGLPRPPAPSQEVERRQMAIAEARQSQRGRWTFTMDNGQRWLQTDSARLSVVRPGMVAEISVGALGNFLMTLDGRTIRVRRLD